MKPKRFNYTSKDGTVRLEKEDFRLPSDNWVWETDWDFDHNLFDVSIEHTLYK